MEWVNATKNDRAQHTACLQEVFPAQTRGKALKQEWANIKSLAPKDPSTSVG